MDEYFRTNREMWDELVSVHVKTRGPLGYNVDEFRRGGTALHPIEVEEVGDVAGKDLLHMQCHFGLDTLSWARLGARVTGVDFSEAGIAAARALAAELRIPARFVLSNVYDLPRNLTDDFDIVYTSYGVLNWLPDLPAWARVIAHFLRPGGFVYLLEAHPFSNVFAWDKERTERVVTRPYFAGPEPERVEEDGSYADPTAHLEHRVSYEWSHTVAGIVDAFLRAGLRIDSLHEFPFCAWECLPRMVKGNDGYFHLPEGEGFLPLTMSVKATKPRHRRDARFVPTRPA
jgi:SAM-dependent methyltransferase